MPRTELTQANHEALKKASVRKGVSIFSLVNNLLEDVGLADKEEKVILSVPITLTRKNRDGLKQWLQNRMEAVLAAYYPKEKTNADVKTN